MRINCAFLFVVLSLISTFLKAQNRQPVCGTDQYLSRILQQYPEAKQQLDRLNTDLRNYEMSNASRGERGLVITIPVVFHVVYSTTSQNISDNQLQSQIDVLNECFRKRAADSALVPAIFKPRHSDTEIQFCLAGTDPLGNTTSGITRHNYTAGTDMDNVIKPATQWDPTRYLNIWTTNLGSGLLGYATMPNIGPSNQDGVVIDYRYVGRPPYNTFNNNYNLGKTAVHEVGHWLGLYHTFNDSCTGTSPLNCALAGDYICDTPPTGAPSYGSPSLTQNTCNEIPVDEPDMWMNYMDYVNDANLLLFTAGQRDRMRGVMNTQRLTIQASLGCSSSNLLAYSGQVLDDATNAPVAGAKVLFDGAEDFEVTTDASGNFTVSALREGNYDVYAGKWGYYTKLHAVNAYYNQSTPDAVVTIRNNHYYDDFVLNYNWSTTVSGASSGLWTRAVTVATFANGTTANPDFDLPDDFGLKCFVTGVNSTSPNGDDVDNGTVTLYSPQMDLSTYTDPYLRYSRWYYDGALNGNQPDDTLYIKLNDGTRTAIVEAVSGTQAGTNQWVEKVFRVSDIMPPTSSMRFIVEASDLTIGNPNIVEAGLDRFEVVEGTQLSVFDLAQSALDVSVYPNPSNGLLYLVFRNGDDVLSEVMLYDLLGQKVYEVLNDKTSRMTIDVSHLPEGMYLLKVRSGNSEKNIKISLVK